MIESTQDLGNDLAGVMALQRKLTGMERDLVAIEAKLSDLQKEAEKLESEHPDQAQAILSRLAEINDVWEEMKTTLKNREESLGEASKLQQFLRDLDDFQSWLSRTQTAIASEDMPNTLTEAEKLLTQHENIKNEINNYEEDYQKMRDMGEMVTQGQTDAQYMFLRQRLQALDTGWNELHKMWENRQNLLSQSHAYQLFLRDTKQAEAFLNNQASGQDIFLISFLQVGTIYCKQLTNKIIWQESYKERNCPFLNYNVLFVFYLLTVLGRCFLSYVVNLVGAGSIF